MKSIEIMPCKDFKSRIRTTKELEMKRDCKVFNFIDYIVVEREVEGD